MNKLSIYQVQNRVCESLPPEVTYSTYPGLASPTVGFIVSEHWLERSYQGVWGAVHHSPNPEDSGHYSTHALLKCAMDNLHGLSWEALR